MTGSVTYHTQKGTMSHLDDATHITNPCKPTELQIRTLRRSPRAKSKNSPVIDFDDASRVWQANKVRRGPMLYYRCTAIQQNGCQCPRAALQGPLHCTQHAKSYQKSLLGGNSCGQPANSPWSLPLLQTIQ